MGRVGVHQVHGATFEVGLVQRFPTFEREISLLLGDKISASEFVKCRCTPCGRGLNADILHQHRCPIQVEHSSGLNFFCLHGVRLANIFTGNRLNQKMIQEYRPARLPREWSVVIRNSP